MPIHRGTNYFQWGNQKKYYYTKGDSKSRAIAKNLAKRQGTAIKISSNRTLYE